MKKIYFILCLFFIPFLTACDSSNKLTCYEDLYKNNFKQTINIVYNNEKTKVDSTNIEVYLNISEIELINIGCTKETKEECIVELEEKYKNSCENILENCEFSEKNENGFTFKANVKKEMIDDYFGDISTTLPINQMRHKIETKLGFTCE